MAPSTTKTNTNAPISLLPATPTDIPILATVSHASFQKDAHTCLKTLYSNYNHESGMTDALHSWISRPIEKGPVMKAITESGEIVGWAAWSFVGFEYHQEGNAPSSSSSKMEIEEKPVEEESTNFPPPPLPPKTNSQNQMEYLSAITNSAMSHYSSILTPPGRKCLILLAINILPSYQGQGIGSRLIEWGTRIADRERVGSWVSSSHDGYKVFERCGYREIGRLSVCLDDFVEGEGNGEKWGEYVWRYLRREAGCV